MRKRIPGVLIVLLLGSPARGHDIESQAPSSPRKVTVEVPRSAARVRNACPEGMKVAGRWRSSEVINLTIDRVDPARVMTLSFYRDGNAVATVGKRGGALAGPVWRWRIDKHGVLLVGDQYSGYGRFRKRCEDDHRLLIDLGGGALTEFKKTKG